ncbi:hypothetical protein [Streptomyces sp. NBC_00893]|nr:hypothetical protein [Streptomyces sp. NBC_00893]MCX4849928.1 hypothetical protein [Streptomyces sp. NBC_00893]
MADECLGLGRCPLPVVLTCGISCPGVTERQEELLGDDPCYVRAALR